MNRRRFLCFAWFIALLAGAVMMPAAGSPAPLRRRALGETRVPLGWFISMALGKLRKTHAKDVDSLGVAAKDWINTLDPNAPDLRKSFKVFSKMLGKAAFAGESEIFITQMRLLYALTSNNSDYITVGTKESPPGKISDLTVRMGPKPEEVGLIKLGKVKYRVTLKPVIDDYELSKDGDIAWARISLTMTVSTGRVGLGSGFTATNDHLWIGVEVGKDYLLPGGKLPVAVSAPTGPFIACGMLHFNETDPKKRFPRSAETKRWPPRRVPSPKAKFGKPFVPPPAVKLDFPRVRDEPEP